LKLLILRILNYFLQKKLVGKRVSKSKTGKYYISVCVKTAKKSCIREFEENNANTIKDTEKAIGIDLGLT
jgi:transposase